MWVQTMTTLNELANTAKRAFAIIDKSEDVRQAQLIKAGKALIAAREQCKVKGKAFGDWLERNGIKRQRAYEAIGAAEGTFTAEADNQRHREKRIRQKSPGAPGQMAACESASGACDFDWDNVKPEDFGDADTAYKRQATFFASEALRYAETNPILHVDPSKVTQKEIQAVRNVAQAWSDLADKLARQTIRKVG